MRIFSIGVLDKRQIPTIIPLVEQNHLASGIFLRNFPLGWSPVTFYSYFASPGLCLDMEKKFEPPWFLIARQALRGCSIESLSVRFKVSAEDIRRHLDKALALDPKGQVRVRNNAEINVASARARNDLVSILLDAIDELACSQAPRLSQLAEFEKLIDSAARLFQWPKSTMLRVHATGPMATAYGSASPPGYGAAVDPETGAPTGAINLRLISTSPEELAILARQERENGASKPVVDTDSK